MTRAQRTAHRAAWATLSVLVAALALWALAERASVPIDPADASHGSSAR